MEFPAPALIENELDNHLMKRVRLSYLLEKYWERYASLKPSARSHYMSAIKPLDRILGSLYWDEVVPSRMRQYRAQRERETNRDGQPIKGSTINREHSVIVHIYNCCLEWMREGTMPKIKMQEVPPTFKVKKASEAQYQRDVMLSQKEFDIFMSVAPKNVQRVCLYAILTTRRRKEIFLLNQENVNRVRGTIQGVQSKTRKLYQNPLSPTIERILRDAKTKQVFKYDFVNFRKDFDAARDAAVKLGVQYFQFRDLRRTGGNHALQVCGDPKAVQELFGHTSIQMTMGYLNIPSKKMSVLADGLEKEFGEPSYPRQWRTKLEVI